MDKEADAKSICKDSKSTWSFVHEIINNKTKKTTSLNSLKINNVKITNVNDISNVMNKYYSTIGHKLVSFIVKPPVQDISEVANNSETFFMDPVSEDEIIAIFKKMWNKGAGVDDINVAILMRISHVVAKPVQYIFSLSIEKGIWPDDLKAAEIVPIYKADDKENPSNYRPISLISNNAKLLEKILHKRIMRFINKSGIISDRQFGFLKNKSTNDALQYLVNYSYCQLDCTKPTIVTFLDLAKAFDTVDHKLLLSKLENQGIRGTPLALLTRYLSDRTQRVGMGGGHSEPEPVSMGVPQGNILGPLFFYFIY